MMFWTIARLKRDGIILLKLVSWKDMEKINASKLFSHQDQGEKLGD